jgi:hypothetical protein
MKRYLIYFEVYTKGNYIGNGNVEIGCARFDLMDCKTQVLKHWPGCDMFVIKFMVEL